MSDQYVLVERVNAVNNVFLENFGLSQRIKFSALDVSNEYIVFCASSGGIYIFNREPCQFCKLIPSQHGAATLVCISENEDHMALAICTGSVIVLENCFKDDLFQQQVFSQHEGHTVTAMKWHGNALYCGDNTGKVSVVTLTTSLAKAFFPTTDACLMHLESPIVQLDTYSKFLLVSTQTRTLLCDTESERYQQIGRQPRDGLMGACFSNSAPSAKGSKPSQWRGIFKNVGNNETFSNAHDNDDVKIFCARPGLRLWKANLKGAVVSTVILRDSAKNPPENVIHLKENANAKFKFTSFPESLTPPPDLNFGKIVFFLDKFILTFKEHAFYIFDVISNTVLLWCNYFHNIRDLKIVQSSLYIWREDFQVDVVALLTVDQLMMKTFLRKQYHLAAELCLTFREEIEPTLETSNCLHSILNLAENLHPADTILPEVLSFLEEVKTKVRLYNETSLKNDIVSVNNVFSTSLKPVKKPKLPATIVAPEEQSLEITLVTSSGEKAEGSDFEILANQYNLNRIGTHRQTTGFTDLLQRSNSNEICDMLHNFQNCLINTEDEEGSNYWCKEMFLRHLSKTNEIGNLERDVLKFAGDAFLIVNESERFACSCGFPLPLAHTDPPDYYDLGALLMKKLDDFEQFTRLVPYMNYYILKKLEDTDLHEIELKLPLIIQFSHYELFRKLARKFTYDMWDESIRLIAKLKKFVCLYCGNNIDANGAFGWNTFSTVMVQSINAINAVKLLKRHAHLIPDGELDEFFYQYTVFQTASGVDSSKGEALDEVLGEESVKKQFGKSVGGFLRKKHVGGEANGRPAPELLTNCDYCKLPLKTPIIDQVNKLSCGHTYHKVCLFHKKDKCYVCDKTVL